MQECLLLLLISSDAHLQVDAREVGLSHYVLRMLDVEQIANRHLRALGGCGSEAQDDGVLREGLLASGLLGRVEAQLLPDHIVNLEIGRPEVMGPFTGAMDLIDADHRDLSIEARKVLDEKALRRDEEHLDSLLRHCLDYLSLHLIRLLRVKCSTWNVRGELLKLISHQRYQRCNYKNQTRHEHRHVLVNK